jgi:phospholipid transport system substrate-binding protein
MKRCIVTLSISLCLILTWFLGVVLVAAVEAESDDTPTEVVLRMANTAKLIRKGDSEANLPLTVEQEKENVRLSRRLTEMIDIKGLSAYILMEYWRKGSMEDRETFMATFSELLEKVAYPNAGKFLQDLTVSVRKEKIRKHKAMVFTSVFHEDEGRIDIDFKLYREEKVWRIGDVLLDGVSLARNLRTQCLKIIREHSFQELLSRMRKRINEEDADEMKAITGRE